MKTRMIHTLYATHPQSLAEAACCEGDFIDLPCEYMEILPLDDIGVLYA